MKFGNIDLNHKDLYNSSVNHPLQSFEWGVFRKKTGIEIIRKGIIDKNKIINPYQLTIHKTPKAPFNIGYLPKGDAPTKDLIDELKTTAKSNNINYIQLEPNIFKIDLPKINEDLKKSFHPLFTKYSFILDLNKTEDELLKNMHQKTRYNIRLSEKKEVKVKIDNNDHSFSDYLELTNETTKRQKFYAHDEKYHKLMWETLGNKSNSNLDPLKLQAHLLKATYKNKTLVTYILFTFKDVLYYPYGASSNEYKEVMASHAAMWGAIKFGKDLGLKKFDMWGAANIPDPLPSDPYYGFHRFKKGFGTDFVEFIGSYDLVSKNLNYQLLKYADKARWIYLKTIR